MLSRLRRKLKQCLVCGDEFNDAVADIMGRKISDDVKFNLLLKLTSYYMKNYMAAYARFAAWENYYERIVVDGNVDREVAKKYVHYEFGNYLYQTVVIIARETSKLNIQQPSNLRGLLEDVKISVHESEPLDFYDINSVYRKKQLLKANMVAKAIDNYCKQDVIIEKIDTMANNFCNE